MIRNHIVITVYNIQGDKPRRISLSLVCSLFTRVGVAAAKIFISKRSTSFLLLPRSSLCYFSRGRGCVHLIDDSRDFQFDNHHVIHVRHACTTKSVPFYVFTA